MEIARESSSEKYGLLHRLSFFVYSQKKKTPSIAISNHFLSSNEMQAKHNSPSSADAQTACCFTQQTPVSDSHNQTAYAFLHPGCGVTSGFPVSGQFTLPSCDMGISVPMPFFCFEGHIPAADSSID